MKPGKIRMNVFCVSFGMYPNNSKVSRTRPKPFRGSGVQRSKVND